MLGVIAEAVQMKQRISKRFDASMPGRLRIVHGAWSMEHGAWLCATNAVARRDIYYSDPASFGSQRVVDDLVDEIAHTIGVDREALNVVSRRSKQGSSS